MPTFFKKSNLSQSQLSNWDNAIAQYNKIHENNMLNSFYSMSEKERKELLQKDYDVNLLNDKTKLISLLSKKFFCLAQPGDEKSALFYRLLNGKKALIKPPPLSFSYPCYEFIEANEPIEIGMMSNNKGIHSLINNPSKYTKYKYILINQCAWKVLQVKSDKEVLVTYGDWENLGFIWNLKLIDLELKNSTTAIICHHDPKIGKILHYDDLVKEVDFQINLHFKKMLISLNENDFQNYKNELKEKYDRMGEAMAEQDKLQSERYIKERMEKNLSIEPTEIEINILKKDRVNMYLSDITVGENNFLYKKAWILTKIQPTNLSMDIYLN